MHSDRVLILFGAGASSGSEPPGIFVPPLGAHLFGKLVDFSPGVWGALPDPYPLLFQKDFEEAFRKLGEDSPNPLSSGFNPTAPCPAQLTGPLLRKMAEYFLDFAPSGKSLYVRLMTRIKEKNWRGVLSTLNYDLLLPIALEKCGSRESLRVCFPHGCCAILIKPGQLAGNPVLIGLGNRIDAELIFEWDVTTARQRLRDETVPPAMCYFEPDKSVCTGHAFIKQQRSLFEQAVREAKTVILIGIQVRERDGHIWDPLAAANAKLVYCSPDVDKFAKWTCAKRFRGQDIALSGTFAERFDQICKYAGLS